VIVFYAAKAGSLHSVRWFTILRRLPLWSDVVTRDSSPALSYRRAPQVVGSAHLWLGLWAALVACGLASGTFWSRPGNATLRATVMGVTPTRLVAEAAFVPAWAANTNSDGHRVVTSLADGSSHRGTAADSGFHRGLHPQ